LPIAELPQPLFGQMPLLDVMVFNRINHTAGTGTGLNINEGYRAYLWINRPRAAIAADDWRLAAAEALDSKWARQLPARAAEIAGLLRG